MRVLHFLPVYAPAWQFGGPVLSVSRLCEGLVQLGVDVHVITTNAGLPDFPQDKLGIPQNLKGVQVTYYPVDQHRGAIRSQALELSLPEHMQCSELVHLSSVWQPLGIPVQRAAHLHNIPVIQTLRGALGPYSWTRNLHKKLPYYLVRELPYLQRATAIHCTTPQEIRESKRLRLRAPLELLPNPVDLSNLSNNPELGNTWREANGIPTDESLFLVAGRFHHKKGLDLLPSVLDIIRTKSWHIALIGDDDDFSRLRLHRSLDGLGLSHRCHWFSSMPSSNLVAPFNAADWLLLPSRHENFGNIVVEGLACGCGVIVSDRVGVSELLSECPGVLVAPRNSLSWSEALKISLSTKRPGAASESWIKSRFSLPTVARQARELYQRILKE